MITLILGGARSGKSDLAVRMAGASRRPVLFVATMQPGDDETRARVAAHRASRPPGWRTAEEPLCLVEALLSSARAGDFVVLDCLTLWLSNLLLAALRDPDHASIPERDAAIASALRRLDDLIGWAGTFDGEIAAVTNEVGMGLVPPYPMGRAFRDALGAANRRVAACAGRVYYLVAGLMLELKSIGAVPVDDYRESPDA